MTGTTAGPSIQKQSRRGTIGRKDSSSTEEITKPEVVRNALGELEKLYIKVKDARVELNEAIKKVAEDAGYNTVAVRAHIIAIASANYEKHKQRVAQQLELFEEAGPLSA